MRPRSPRDDPGDRRGGGVNILILERDEVGALIPRSDRRWSHLRKVLKKGPGDKIAAGLLGEKPGEPESQPLLGEATIRELGERGLVLDFEGGREPPPLAPLRLVLGFPRPIQANRILKDIASLGVAEVWLTGTELGEKSYAQSSIFKDKDFRGALIEGAEQAGNPLLPRVVTHWSLRLCLDAIEAEDAREEQRGKRIFLHPYGGAPRMGAIGLLEAPVTLAIGSERGWTDPELAALVAAGYEQRGLGNRILKTETAVVSGIALALAGLGLL
jgi:16S rRNA (uracil1498-N3)-methyltransferase